VTTSVTLRRVRPDAFAPRRGLPNLTCWFGFALPIDGDITPRLENCSADWCHVLRPTTAAMPLTGLRESVAVPTRLSERLLSRASHRRPSRYNVPESDTRRTTTMSLADEIKRGGADVSNE
jgi:hypothetical protein